MMPSIRVLGALLGFVLLCFPAFLDAASSKAQQKFAQERLKQRQTAALIQKKYAEAKVSIKESYVEDLVEVVELAVENNAKNQAEEVLAMIRSVSPESEVLPSLVEQVEQLDAQAEVDARAAKKVDKAARRRRPSAVRN